MQLTIGPIPFFWPADRLVAFYDRLSEAPVDRVVLGEQVCSKRLPFYEDRLPELAERLTAAGKEVVMTGLGLITLPRERKAARRLAEAGMEVEINDFTALTYLPKGTAFSVGPLVNVYNESTLEWLAERGARRISLPPELPLASVEVLAGAAARLGVIVEVWAHGRAPLAIAGRCYHARLHGRTKDDCQFACEEDPDGLVVDTIDGTPLLAMNGVQTLSAAHVSAVHQLEALEAAGVGALRLSPQSEGFAELTRIWRDRLQTRLDGESAEAAIRALYPAIELADGYLAGDKGADWSAAPRMMAVRA